MKMIDLVDSRAAIIVGTLFEISQLDFDREYSSGEHFRGLFHDVRVRPYFEPCGFQRRSSESLRFSAIGEAGRHKVVSLARVVIGQPDEIVF